MQLASFGQRLKELRVELGLTQDQLVIAFKAKFPDVRLDKSKISRYERGETKPARFEVVECLSYFFEMCIRDRVISPPSITTVNSPLPSGFSGHFSRYSPQASCGSISPRQASAPAPGAQMVSVPPSMR